MKRIFRGPWLWIVLAVVGVLLALQFLSSDGGYDEITTSKMTSYINSGEVSKITFVDGDQAIRATLDKGDKVSATWVSGTQVDLVATAAGREVLQGEQHAHDGDDDPEPGALEYALHKASLERGLVELTTVQRASRTHRAVSIVQPLSNSW